MPTVRQRYRHTDRQTDGGTTYDKILNNSVYAHRNKPTAWADSTDSNSRGGAWISATTTTYTVASKLVLSSLKHCALLLLRYLSICY